MNIKLNTSTSKALLDLMRGGATLAEACRELDINRTTVWAKCRRDEEFNAAFYAAKQAGTFSFQELARDKSRKAILRRIEGYTVVETTKQTDADGNVISQTHREKHVAPSVPLLMACLKQLEGWDIEANAMGIEAPAPTLVVNFAPDPDLVESQNQSQN